MNDPWLPLIAALSGQRIATPSTWPVRNVHRIDGCYFAAQAGAQRRSRQETVRSVPVPAR
jgi:hypothetical protein